MRLRVVESSVGRVTRSRSLLTVETQMPDNRATVRQQMEAWFTAQARRMFAEHLKACYAGIAHWGLPMPALSIRPVAAWWGSLTPKRHIDAESQAYLGTYRADRLRDPA